jgi:hypothetical protein
MFLTKFKFCFSDAEWQDNYYVDSARDEGRKTPPKFTQPHCIVRFSPTGQLVKVNAARVDEGEAATFELHSLEVQFNFKAAISILFLRL